MKKIIIILALLSVVGWFIPAQNAYAVVEGQEGAIKSGQLNVGGTKPAFQDYQFNLGKTLKIEDQKQTYLWGENNQGPGQRGPLVDILLRVITIMTYVIGSLAFVIIIFSGLWLIAAHGEQSQIEKGKKILTYSIVGLIFAFASYIIITFVQSLLA